MDVEHLSLANRKMLKFDKFSGKETKNTIEHVAWFTAQCRETTANPFLKFFLFNMSLTKTTFIWYTNLPANSIQEWDELEWKFHKQFYGSEPKLSMANLALYRQKSGETVKVLELFQNDQKSEFREDAGIWVRQNGV